MFIKGEGVEETTGQVEATEEEDEELEASKRRIEELRQFMNFRISSSL